MSAEAPERDLLRLERVVEHCDAVAERIGRFSISRESFAADSALRDLLLTPVSQIGELGGKLSEATRSSCLGEDTWRQVRGFRNLFVHVYDRVDVDIAWDIATRDVPALREGVLSYLSSLGPRRGVAGPGPSGPGSVFDGAPRLEG